MKMQCDLELVAFICVAEVARLAKPGTLEIGNAGRGAAICPHELQTKFGHMTKR